MRTAQAGRRGRSWPESVVTAHIVARAAQYVLGGVRWWALPLQPSSFRRRPESIFAFIGWASAHRSCFFLALTRRPTHVPVFFRPPSWRSGHFSLLAQREVTKRKAPSRPRSPVKPATAQAR